MPRWLERTFGFFYSPMALAHATSFGTYCSVMYSEPVENFIRMTKPIDPETPRMGGTITERFLFGFKGIRYAMGLRKEPPKPITE